MFVKRLFVLFLVQQENFDTDLLDNVNIGPLNEEINFSITQEEILRCIKKSSSGLPLFFYIGFILPTSQMSGISPELKIALNIFS
jgi:hypothetical protein